jgi:hypothetical protein
MTVRTDEPKILSPVVVVLAIDVIDLECDGRALPFPEAADLTSKGCPKLNERAPKLPYLCPWCKFRLNDK